MGKSIGISQFYGRRYKVIPLTQEWIEVLGPLERGFRMIIWGESGHGKTTFALRLSKMLAGLGKVYFNSIEQGDSASLQKQIMQVGMNEVNGRVIFGDRDTFEEMIVKLKNNKCQFLIIDSLQYAELTQGQYKKLNELFPKRGIILISWQGNGNQPKGEHAKAIRYMVDVKVHVKKGVAKADSRYGQTIPYTIFSPAVKPGDNLSLFGAGAPTAELPELPDPPADPDADDDPDDIEEEVLESLTNNQL